MPFGQQTSTRDDEAVRRRREQTRALLFADCRNPFEDVKIAARMRQILHTHQGRDKLFKCIMYFLRIYMWTKNIKLNFNFIEGASEENFTLVERNYMSIMNSRRLFRLGRFVGEWVRIQVTLLKSAQLIYAPSKSKAMSVFVQLQMVLDVMARLLLCAKCMGDDLAYISQKGFLHSSIAGKLLYVGARLAVPVMTSDLFLNSLNLAQRVLDARHVVTVRENPEEYALLEADEEELPNDGGEAVEYGGGDFYDQQHQQHFSITGNPTAGGGAATLLNASNPYASFETLPKTSVDDFGDIIASAQQQQQRSTTTNNINAMVTTSQDQLKSTSSTLMSTNVNCSASQNQISSSGVPMGGGGINPIAGSLRNLRRAAAAAGIDGGAGSNVSAFVATREGHSGGVTVGTIFSSPCGSSGPVGQRSSYMPSSVRNSMSSPPSAPFTINTNNNNNQSNAAALKALSNDSIAVPNSALGTPTGPHEPAPAATVGGGMHIFSAKNEKKSPAMRPSASATFVDASGNIKNDTPQQGAFAPSSSGAKGGNAQRGGMRKSKSMGAFSSHGGDTHLPPAVVVSATLVEDTEKARVGRSFSLLYTLNDLDRKRKGIQKLQEAQQQCQVITQPSVAVPSSTVPQSQQYPTLNNAEPPMHPMMGVPVGSDRPYAHTPFALDDDEGHGDLNGNDRMNTNSSSWGASALVEGAGAQHQQVTTPRRWADTQASPHSAEQHQSPTAAVHHRRTLSSATPASLRPVVVGGGNLTNYVHALYHPQIDPNNIEERDAVMKAADASDLLELISKNDGDGEEPSTSFSAAMLRSQLTRCYSQGHGLQHAHSQVGLGGVGPNATVLGVGVGPAGVGVAVDAEPDASVGVGIGGAGSHGGGGVLQLHTKGDAAAHLTDTQIIDGNIGAPRENRLKAIATSIVTQRSLQLEHRMANANAVPPNQQQLQQQRSGHQQNARSHSSAGDGKVKKGKKGGGGVVRSRKNTIIEGHTAAQEAKEAIEAENEKQKQRRRSEFLSEAASATAATEEACTSEIDAAFRSVAGDVTRLSPQAPLLDANFVSAEGGGGRSRSRSNTSTALPTPPRHYPSAAGSLNIEHSAPTSLQGIPAASLQHQSGGGGQFLLSKRGGISESRNEEGTHGGAIADAGEVAASPSPTIALHSNSSFAALGTTLGNIGSSHSTSTQLALIAANRPTAAVIPAPAATPSSPPKHVSAAARLKMAVDRSIEAYTYSVSQRDGLTPVNNYAQLLWRDYELHWACVTQLKLILDYYVLLSVVFNWEGVRGRTAIMGLVSGLLSLYRVFVYGR